MSNFLNQLSGLLGVDSGAAGNAAKVEQLRIIYQKEFIDAAEQGKTLPPFEEWVKQYKVDANPYKAPKK